mgnify:CR=1 FL=1
MSISKMYFNYNNDVAVYVLPVLPEELQIKMSGETNSVTVDSFGEVVHKGKRDGITVKFSSFFPAEYGKYYCSCSPQEFRKPSEWHKWIQSLIEADQPMHFVYTNSPNAMNFYADITSYTAKEEGGDAGTIYYTIELREHRVPTIRTYKKPASTTAVTKKTKKTTKKKVVKKTTKKRVNNKTKTPVYTITTTTYLYESVWGRALCQIPKGSTVQSDEKTETKDKYGTDGYAATWKDNQNASNGEEYQHVCYNSQWGYVLATYVKKS